MHAFPCLRVEPFTIYIDKMALPMSSSTPSSASSPASFPLLRPYPPSPENHRPTTATRTEKLRPLPSVPRHSVSMTSLRENVSNVTPPSSTNSPLLAGPSHNRQTSSSSMPTPRHSPSASLSPSPSASVAFPCSPRPRPLPRPPSSALVQAAPAASALVQADPSPSHTRLPSFLSAPTQPCNGHGSSQSLDSPHALFPEYSSPHARSLPSSRKASVDLPWTLIIPEVEQTPEVVRRQNLAKLVASTSSASSSTSTDGPTTRTGEESAKSPLPITPIMFSVPTSALSCSSPLIPRPSPPKRQAAPKRHLSTMPHMDLPLSRKESKRLSQKWIREKHGKRWVEDDYQCVLRSLRALR